MSLTVVHDEDQPPNVFIQKQNEFLRKGSQKYLRWMSEEATGSESLQSETVSIAISVQNAFHNVTMVLQGFLSGFCACQAFLSFSYFRENDRNSFNIVSPYVQSVLYVCFVLSAIAAFDRFETGSTLLGNVKRAVLMQQGGLAVCIWMLGNIFNLIATTSEQMLFDSDPHSDEASPFFKSVYVWRYLCVARACAATLGWLLMALQPNHNHLRQQLVNIRNRR